MFRTLKFFNTKKNFFFSLKKIFIEIRLKKKNFLTDSQN